MIAAIDYKINDNCTARIYVSGMYSKVNWDKEPIYAFDNCLCYDYKNEESKRGFIIEDGLDGNPVLRLIETEEYVIEVEESYAPHFQNEFNRLLKVKRNNKFTSFQFVNYLGRSRIVFGQCDNAPVFVFEVVPNKMKYVEDYIGLTNSLAEICNQILLEHIGSTSSVYEQDEENEATLLEQFIFLRQFCYDQNLLSYFESIRRNPDRILVKEDTLRPIGSGMPSKRFFTNPFSNSRGWDNVAVGGGPAVYMPQEISVTHKRDSLDTPANRFLKFALEKFYDICDKLIDNLEKNDTNKNAECLREARIIKENLEDIFNDSFFDEIGNLVIVPQNNQVLQKREGYSQIFNAFSMVDLALKLKWEGKDDVYEGEAKNVALLYEYWLFFKLFEIIKTIPGCKMIGKNDEKAFIRNDKLLTINLKEGQSTYQSFRIEELGLKVNLYYNRTFSRKDFVSTQYEGSYSGSFRPDYTLAIFPDIFKNEKSAIAQGSVSYLHFDAKYRITDLTAFIGNDEKGLTDEQVEVLESKELDEEKYESVTNTYKRGDLLKMHTYNDAIRRTIGSYVLYPGTETSEDGSEKKYRLYDEILPGVGAFAVKPSIESEGAKVLQDFIVSVLTDKSKQHTRLNRMEHYNEMVIREPNNCEVVIEGNKRVDIVSTVIGYLRTDYYDRLIEQDLLKVGKEFMFYFYAINGTQVYSHHKDVFTTKNFKFYKNDIDSEKCYRLEPVLCEILSNELVPKESLQERLIAQGTSKADEIRSADFYYVLRVKVVSECSETTLTITEVNNQNGNDTFSPHSPKVVSIN